MNMINKYLTKLKINIEPLDFAIAVLLIVLIIWFIIRVVGIK